MPAHHADSKSDDCKTGLLLDLERRYYATNIFIATKKIPAGSRTRGVVGEDGIEPSLCRADYGFTVRGDLNQYSPLTRKGSTIRLRLRAGRCGYSRERATGVGVNNLGYLTARYINLVFGMQASGLASVARHCDTAPSVIPKMRDTAVVPPSSSKMSLCVFMGRY